MQEYEFVKVNDEPIEIEYITDEHNAEKDFQPSFWFNNRRYYLDDFLKTQSPWTNMNVPDYIHGYEMDNYYNPLFIELIEDEAVNVYEEVRKEN